ncbi:hypothetical protein [Saccharopolyspora sp. NPDC002578]
MDLAVGKPGLLVKRPDAGAVLVGGFEFAGELETCWATVLLKADVGVVHEVVLLRAEVFAGREGTSGVDECEVGVDCSGEVTVVVAVSEEPEVEVQDEGPTMMLCVELGECVDGGQQRVVAREAQADR